MKGGPFKINAPILLESEEESLIAGVELMPIGVSMDAANWKYYDPNVQDVFSDCQSEILNHSILVVGYTPTYYIVKNSWNTDWGLDGYIHIAREGNMCGILEEAVMVK